MTRYFTRRTQIVAPVAVFSCLTIAPELASSDHTVSGSKNKPASPWSKAIGNTRASAASVRVEHPAEMLDSCDELTP
jgi:hypothetical protein